MAFEEPGATAIVVRTPEADSLFGEIYRLHSKAGAEGMTPHVTLLVPFLHSADLDPMVDSRLCAVFASVSPFDYALTRLERFAGGILYLAPEPSRPFVELTKALWRAFPDYPPYGGIHDEVVPHATVAQSDDDSFLGRIEAELEPQLPLRGRAEAATIVERGEDRRWRPRVAFPLGG